MASTFLRVLPAIATSIFSLLSLIFSLLAVTSKKWAVRDNYDPSLNPLDWKDPIYTLYRSPFQVCTANLLNASAAESSQPTAADFSVQCSQFRPWGFNHTSCELAIATQDDTASTIGDARLCQQIHYAGNFWIASSTFIGLAFLLTLILAVFTFVKRPQFAGNTIIAAKSATQRDDEHQGALESGQIQPSDSSPQQTSAWVPWVALILLIFVFLGFTMALIGQYYGVLGLIQSLPNNADFASSSAGSKDDINTQGNHGPWFQGVGLSVYATLSWAFAIATGTIASQSWRLPQWRVVL